MFERERYRPRPRFYMAQLTGPRFQGAAAVLADGGTGEMSYDVYPGWAKKLPRDSPIKAMPNHQVALHIDQHTKGASGSILVRIEHLIPADGKLVPGYLNGALYEVPPDHTLNNLPGKRRFIHGSRFVPNKPAFSLSQEGYNDKLRKP